MVDCHQFYEEAVELGIGLFCGVPDSLLKEFCACLQDLCDSREHVVVSNEGAGVALAAGCHLASGELGLVYMQNSGLGNAVNPLVSLTSQDVYGIPLLLMVGWRGEPGTNDEPQHLLQGRTTLSLLDDLEIGYRVLPTDTEEAILCLREAAQSATSRSCPEAIIVRRDTFESYPRDAIVATPYEMVREQAVTLIVDQLGPTDLVIATTGGTSRELHEIRRSNRVESSEQDFLVVGSMGHSSQIALGIALKQPDRRVYCLDGDGALIMHMGSLAVVGGLAPENLAHVVLNNGCHESVGGQPTVGLEIDIPAIAAACGYRYTRSVTTVAELQLSLAELSTTTGPALIEVRISQGSRQDLGRPKGLPQESKNSFMRFART